VSAQTVDGQQIVVKYTVLFRFPATQESATILQNIGNVSEVVENVVKASSRNLARLLAQSFTAEDLYGGTQVLVYQQVVRDDLLEKFNKLGYGLILDDFLVRKIEFDADYVQSIEEQQIAQEKIETAQYDSQAAEFERDRQIRLSEAEKQKQILLAEADARQIELKADADAYGIRVQADAEAYSIDIQGRALRANPMIMQWEFIKNLDIDWGLLPSDGVVPLLPLEAPK
jgi:regulator of protease activity HflC (stomatin/prohibitin superfamily)